MIPTLSSNFMLIGLVVFIQASFLCTRLATDRQTSSLNKKPPSRYVGRGINNTKHRAVF